MSTLRSLRFRKEHEADWRRLEELLGKVERSGARRLTAEEAIELPRVYRAALSSLSVARETLLEKATLDYLEALVARGYLAVYTTHTRPLKAIRDFLVEGWPRSVRALVPEMGLAALLFVFGAAASFVLVGGDPDWFYSLVPRELAAGRGPEASAESLRTGLYRSHEASMLGAFAALLFSNNTGVSLLAFALGFAFGLPTIVLLIYNGAMLGAMMSVYAAKGLSFGFTGWLMIHGTTELLAIVIAGAAGLRIGRMAAFPGMLGRGEAIRQGGRHTAPAMVGVVLMLVLAAVIEGYGRQLITSDAARYGIAVGTGLFWLVFFSARPEAADQGGRA